MFFMKSMSYGVVPVHLSLFPLWFQLCLLRIGSLNVDWAPLLVMSGASLVREQYESMLVLVVYNVCKHTHSNTQ